VAKEFKDFDTKFSRAQINVVLADYLYNGSSEADRNGYKRWDLKLDYWTNDEIRQAVYELEDSERWQLFRVSMKGRTTSEKLYMLHNYYAKHDAATVAREKCRIDNYIGALKRGGQLDSTTLQVLK
jgi:hypothetical protein